VSTKWQDCKKKRRSGMPNPVFKEMVVMVPSNPEDLTVQELQYWEKSLGELRMQIRSIQLDLRKIMEEKGWRPGEPQQVFAHGVPSPKGVGTPGG
jgi:hypothetical protein